MEETTDSNINDGEITQIKFSLATHDEICKSSATGLPINHRSQLANAFLGLPLENGKCETCDASDPHDCEGHFGFIEMPIPIYHPSHVTELRQMLNLICLNCLTLKVNKALTRNSDASKVLMGSCCDICDVKVKEKKTVDGAILLELKMPSRIKKDDAWKFLSKYGYQHGNGDTRTFLPFEVLAMLKKLPAKTKAQLKKKGFFPQVGYLIQYLPVPPNCLILSDKPDEVNVPNDVTSSMLKKILKQIEAIKSTRTGLPIFQSHEVEVQELSVVVYQYLRSRGTRTETRKGAKSFRLCKETSVSSTKAWLEKMKTLFISKGSGFSSRSVITGEIYKGVNEIGLPLEVAKKMTIEEKVSCHNISFLQNLVDNSLCLLYRDKATLYSLKEGSIGHTRLKPGQVVHRRVMEGDIVFVNRPPTTHKHSFQALSVYIHDDHTIKINPVMCKPLSADFDGDCVHIFYPQSLASRAEAVELFAVGKQLISSHTGNFNLQLSVDSLLSLKMLLKLFILRKETAQQLAMFSSAPLPPPAFPVTTSISDPCWTALQVLQTSLPPDFSCHMPTHLIRKSEILTTDLNRGAIQSMINEISSSIMCEKGSNEALKFFDSLQPLLMENIFCEGFSICLRDYLVESEVAHSIQTNLQQQISPILSQLSRSQNEMLKLQLKSHLQEMKEPLANFILKSSTLGDLIDSKSESHVNKVVEQIGFLGLQLHEEGTSYSKKMVQNMTSFFHRIHPLHAEFSCLEHGLVRSSFINGLDPYEGMLHSVATRDVILRSSKGLTDPGTLFKNLMAILRDVVMSYDGTVRNSSSNFVIQLDYGAKIEMSNSLFPPGESVGALAATAISHPAYKAVLDSSSNNNNSWKKMKEILYCPAIFNKDEIHRRVILYLNECKCNRQYCQEKASLEVKKALKKITLRDVAQEFLIEYKSQTASDDSEMDKGFIGHIHLNKKKLSELNINSVDLLVKCEEERKQLKSKKKLHYCAYFEGMLFSFRECCYFCEGSEKSYMPCLKFYWEKHLDITDTVSHVMSNLVCPALLQTVIKGDPRISEVNITWIDPGTALWIQSSSENSNGELALEVTVEGKLVRQGGDAWGIVMDCCLPVLHLIDTQRSIPYSTKQIQEVLGIASSFDQTVQRLAISVGSFTKDMLKEHILLLASSMTQTGNLIGFNKSGIKAMYRAMGVQAPFAEATLNNPRKCFERAAEKCHVAPLSNVITSCSWGKLVDVGTGANFDILWSPKMKQLVKEGTDVYEFLNLVRAPDEGGIGCLGEDDVDRLKVENRLMEETGDCKAVFEDTVTVESDPEDNTVSGCVKPGQSRWKKGLEDKNYNSNSDEGILGSGGSESWGKTDEPFSSSWGEQVDAGNDWNASRSGKPQAGAVKGWNAFGRKKTLAENSNSDEPQAESATHSSWGLPPKNASVEISGWGSFSKKSDLGAFGSQDCISKKNSGDGGWQSSRKPSQLPSSQGRGSNFGAADERLQNTWKNAGGGDSSGWGSSREADKPASITQGWVAKDGTQSSWGKPSAAESSQGWGSKLSTDNAGEAKSSWGQPSPQASNKSADESGLGWGKTNSFTDNAGREAKSSWGQPSPQASNKSADESGLGWGKTNISTDNAGGEAKSSWGQLNPTTSENATFKSSQWSQGIEQSEHGSENDNTTQSPWGQAGGWKQKSFNPGWGSSENSQWKNKRSNNRPGKLPLSGGSQPGGTNVRAPLLLTVTRQRFDIFEPEEQEILSEVETMMKSIRRIMNQPGYNDGEPLAPADQTYIMDNIFCHHPAKEAKVGTEFDHFTVAKHSKFQDTRCFHVVLTDGHTDDFSYWKCLENMVKVKYPDRAESFIPKYFKRPQRGIREQQGQRLPPRSTSVDGGGGEPNCTAQTREEGDK